MTLRLLVVSIFRRRILRRFFLRIPSLSALPPKSASRTRSGIFGFTIGRSQVVVDLIKSQSAYQKLYDRPWAKQIRLIRLLPSKDFGTDVHCEVFRASLNRHPAYEALSYAWGDPKNFSFIYLEGVRSQVTSNLEEALRHLRYEDRERILWADALSINQHDVRERNSQVRKMRSIYMEAKNVMVWLGPEQDAEIALKFCKGLRKIRRMEVSEVYGKADLLEYENHYDPWMISSQYERDKLKWKACEALFTGRPWWSRTWIIQEVLHGGRIDFQIGKIVVSFGELHWDYRMYMTMKARSQQADISFSIDTQLDRAITYSLLKDERQRIARRAHDKEVDMDSTRDIVGQRPCPDINAQNQSNVLDIDHVTRSREALQRREVALVFESTLRYFKGLNSIVSLSQIAAAREPLIPDPDATTVAQPATPLSYSLLSLLRMFRNQQASDPRDKVYSFLGMASHTCNIPIDYHASKRTVYLHTAHMLRLHSGLLSSLLAVESPERPVASTCVLPSWVPDWTTRQMLASRFKEELAGEFNAHNGLSVMDVEYSTKAPPEILVVKGVYVGVITGTHVTKLMQGIDTDDEIKLIRYSTLQQHRHALDSSTLSPWPASRTTKTDTADEEAITIANTSWGPWWSSIGDIIIVAAGSTVPLILRPITLSSSSPTSTVTGSAKIIGQTYLLVGTAILIDSQLHTLGLGNLEDDVGFSRIMFGSAWQGESGVEVEEFRLC